MDAEVRLAVPPGHGHPVYLDKDRLVLLMEILERRLSELEASDSG